MTTDPVLAYPLVPAEFTTVTSVGGARLSVRAYGPPDGDVIVFAHGWTMNANFWRAQINDLAEKHRVICYDQRGHGRSTMGAITPRIELLGHDLARVLKTVVPEGKKALLVGHSMGGMTIMSWAQQYPGEVERLARAVILCSTASRKLLPEVKIDPTSPTSWLPNLELAVTRAVMANPYWFPSGELGRRRLRLALGRVAADAHVKFTEELSEACPQRTRGLWGAALLKLDVTEGLTRLAVPTAVLVGDEDRLTPKRHSRAMVEVLSEVDTLERFEIWPGCGHQAPIERHAEFNAVVHQLLAATV